ncbi:hypothetical protein Syun_007691 [Stephania yunnanensis]|uniref:Uncharacterized protein n=1 Tax=Stephania yunnanensis TaxID=152371 RepID=A0AAP0PZJ6_9MAGN
MRLEYLIGVFYVEDTEVFKVCLDYWNILVLKLFEAHRNMDNSATAGVMSLRMLSGMVDGLGSQILQRRIYMLWSNVKVAGPMISRMAKLEEVPIVEDENGNIVWETMKDNDVLNQYKFSDTCERVDISEAVSPKETSRADPTTPDQPVDDEAVYYKVAGDCPKGCVYSLRSLWRKKRRYVDPDASTSQCSGDDVLESGLRLAGTVIRRSTAWSRGNPRVSYAFVLVHGVKLDRRQCRCASHRVVAKETRNSVKELLRRARRRRSRGRAAVMEKGHAVAEKVASGGENVGQQQKRREPVAAEKGGKGGAMLGPMALAFKRGDQRRRRRRSRRGAGGQSGAVATRPAVSSFCVAEEGESRQSCSQHRR